MLCFVFQVFPLSLSHTQHELRNVHTTCPTLDKEDQKRGIELLCMHGRFIEVVLCSDHMHGVGVVTERIRTTYPTELRRVTIPDRGGDASMDL